LAVLVLEVLGAIGALPVLYLFISKIYQYVTRNVLYKDMHCRVLDHRIKGKTFTTRIKIAYTGTRSEALEDVLLTYRLKLRSPYDRFLSYVNVAVGYLLCDMQGLATLLGTQHHRSEPPMVHLWKQPRAVKYPVSILVGLMFLYDTLLMLLLPPIGWIVLNSGLYGRFSLDGIMENMTITNEEGKVIRLPTILQPGTEITLDFKYRMGLKAKGFSIDTPYRFLSDFPKRTIRPPKPGNFVWAGKGGISMLMGTRWNRLLAEFGEKVIVGIGSK
jgi:hypothetical protein